MTMKHLKHNESLAHQYLQWKSDQEGEVPKYFLSEDQIDELCYIDDLGEVKTRIHDILNISYSDVYDEWLTFSIEIGPGDEAVRDMELDYESIGYFNLIKSFYEDQDPADRFEYIKGYLKILNKNIK